MNLKVQSVTYNTFLAFVLFNDDRVITIFKFTEKYISTSNV